MSEQAPVFILPFFGKEKQLNYENDFYNEKLNAH